MQPPKHLQKIPGASARTGLGSGRGDPLEAALLVKDVFLKARLSPCLEGTCFTVVAAEM